MVVIVAYTATEPALMELKNTKKRSERLSMWARIMAQLIAGGARRQESAPLHPR